MCVQAQLMQDSFTVLGSGKKKKSKQFLLKIEKKKSP